MNRSIGMADIQRDKPATVHTRNRLQYVDDIRSLIIFLVVLAHAAITYSGIGSWYIIENKFETLDILSKVALGFFISFNEAWIMCILFFFGGFFAMDSLSRKSVSAFVADKLLRLGLPLISYMFVITPLMLYFIAFPDTFQAKGGFWQQYTRDYIGSGLVWSATGPLWFVEVLLGFSLILALLVETARHLPRKGPPRSEPDGEPSLLFFASVIVAVAAATFIIRLFRPIGTRFANFQVCFFASYIALFLLGVRSAKKRWFARAAAAGNRIWFAAALGIGIPAWIAIILLGGLLDGNIAKLLGGWTLQSAFYSLWEAFVALSMCIGLCALFANQRRRRETVSFFFSRNSFSVFVFHPVFMLALTRYFAAWKLAPLPKALFLGLTTYGLSLLFAEFVVRKIPVIKNLL